MKKIIWLVFLLFVFFLAVASQANAQIVSTETVISTGTTIAELAESTPLVKMDKNEVAVKEPKFSVSMGLLGLGYNFGVKETKAFDRIGNARVLSAKIGYSPWKYVKIQGDYSVTGDFKQQRITGTNSKPTTIQDSWSFKTYTINLELGIPVVVVGIPVFPHILAGYGKTDAEYNIRMKRYGAKEVSMDLAGSGRCVKIGAGLNAEVYSNKYVGVFLFSELTYVKVNKTSVSGNVGGDSVSLDITPHYSTSIGGIGVRF